MTKPRIARITAGDVMLDQYFSAIDQGLGLWLAMEKSQTGREDRYAALCAGSCEALERAIDVLRSFARTRKLVSVRVTSKMLADVPHGRLTPSQVFYRWKYRIGESATDSLRGAPTIDGRTFAVRPIMKRTAKRGERLVEVEVALMRSKRLRPEVISLAIDEQVDLTYPLRPSDPAQLAAAAQKVVHLAEAHDARLSKILTAIFEEFGVQIRNMLATLGAWLRRHRVKRISTPVTLILASEHGVEEVLLAAAGGGGSSLSSSRDPSSMEIAEITKADEARALLQELFQQPLDAFDAGMQNTCDVLDSMPSEEAAEMLRSECVRIQTTADRVIAAAAADLTAQHLIDDAWLPRIRAEAAAATREIVLGPTRHEAALDLARRAVHGGTQITPIAGQLALRAAAERGALSEAHREAIAVTQYIAKCLPQFYGTPLLHATLSERLAILRRVLERFNTPVDPEE